MNFKETLEWLYGFQKFGIKLGLERIRYIVDELGNPQNNYETIHVGGTNGKGSVCSFLGSIMNCNGYKVGVYTSPHLQHISERIIVDNVEIFGKELVDLVEKIKPIVNKMVEEGDNPTFYEIVTAIAFQYFNLKNVDFAIIEVGLGGRFDATNIVKPLVSVITNVSLEHQHVLGEKTEDIAFEKAGIIKDDVPVVTSAKGNSLKVIENIAKNNNAPVSIINKNKWKRLNQDLNGQQFSIKGFFKEYNVKTSILGEHQGGNIALAIATVEQLQKKGVYVTEKGILNGVEKTINPGRMELMHCKPYVLLDGAHNPSGMKTLVKSLNSDFEYNNLIVVLGILSDKDIEKMVSIISPIADVIVTTKPCNDRTIDPFMLKRVIERFNDKKNVLVEEDVKKAVAYANSIAQKDDFICVTGSLFTVGEAREYHVKNLQKC